MVTPVTTTLSLSEESDINRLQYQRDYTKAGSTWRV